MQHQIGRVAGGFIHLLWLGVAPFQPVGIAHASTNQVLSLSSPSDYVEIADSDSLNLVDQFTLEAWIKPSVILQREQTLISIRRSESGTALALRVFGRGVGLGFNNDPGDGTGLNLVFGGGDIIDAGFWHHVAATYDGTTGKVYIDGRLAGSHEFAGRLLNSSLPLVIGQEALVGDPRPFAGYVDEVRVWSRALSVDEVQANLWRTLLGNESGLVGYWDFSGGNATDRSSYANHGRFIGEAHAVAESTPFPRPVLNCAAPPVGLVGWWTGDGHTNNLAGEHGAILVNTTFRPGQVEQAFSLTGNGSHVRIPYNSTFAALTNSLSLEAWIWLNRSDPPSQRFVTLSPDSAYLACFNGRFSFNLALGQVSPAHQVLAATNAVEIHQWYHLVAAYDGRVQTLYVNGEPAASAEIGPPLNPIGQGAAPELFISFLGQNALDGMIDEVAVYSRALNPAEVQANFAAGYAGMCKQSRISSISVLFPGTARLEVKGPPVRELHVQRSNDLISWSLLSTLSNFTGRSQVIDLDAGSDKWRFYRVQRTAMVEE